MDNIDENSTQLIHEIERSRREDDGIDSGIGISVNRMIVNGNTAEWEVFFGQSQEMTILDSKTDFRNMPAADIAAKIIGWWDAEWDD